MPKLKKSESEQKNINFRASVASRMELNDYERKEDVANHIGMTRQTFATKLKDPDKITLGELRRLKRTLRMTDDFQYDYDC